MGFRRNPCFQSRYPQTGHSLIKASTKLALTKIFFRPGMLAYLETLRSDRLNVCAILIQKNMLSNLYRKKYLRLRKGMVMTQTRIRGFLARKMVENLRRNHAAVTIQRYIRGLIARTSYYKARKQVIQLQALSSWDSCSQRVPKFSNYPSCGSNSNFLASHNSSKSLSSLSAQSSAHPMSRSSATCKAGP